MKTISSTIQELSGIASPVIDRSNTNRYCVAVKNNDTIESYYFSTPIYRLTDGALVTRRFRQVGDKYMCEGSSAYITVDRNGIVMSDRHIQIKVSFEQANDYVFEEGALRSPYHTIEPTFNGLAFRMRCNKNEKKKIFMSTSSPAFKVRENNVSLSLMREEFTPYATVSSIYSLSQNGACYPMNVRHERTDDNCHTLELCSTMNADCDMLFELNLYESKLFHDTPVESLRRDENYAYVSSAFIGKSETFGEQWLYSRPDFSRIPEINERDIRSATWYLPLYKKSGPKLNAHRMEERFCSFGSTWANKTTPGDRVIPVDNATNYLSVDATKLVHEQKTTFSSQGFAIIPVEKESGFTVFATGDNSFTPQILRIIYDKYHI